MQMDLHKPEQWLLSEHSVKALALVLKSGISIASDNLKADSAIHISPEGVHVGGTIKVIIVSFISLPSFLPYRETPTHIYPHTYDMMQSADHSRHRLASPAPEP